MRICLQLIENYLKQQIPTIIFTVDNQKYIFNMPTCFQRFLKDHKQKFPKGSVIFFTKTSTETLAGLTGFMLTIFNSKFCEDTKLYVSDAMYRYLEEVRYKMGFKMLPYSYSNLLTGQTRSGIRYVHRVQQLLQRDDYPQIFMNSEKYISQLPLEDRNSSGRLLNEKNEYIDKDLRIIGFQIQCRQEKLMNYICIPNKLEGKVLMNKVKQLKIPPKLISKLLAEGTLQLEDGSIVQAVDIKEPESPSPNVLILHYNCIESIQKIVTNAKLVEYLKNPEYITDSIVHIVENPEEQAIVESKQFCHMISLFPKSRHILFNRNYRNKDQELCQEPTSKHLELVSFVHQYFPISMPDILTQHHSYINAHLKSTKLLQDLFQGYNVLAYRRNFQLVLAPKRSQGYFAINEPKFQKQKKDFVIPPGLLNPLHTQSLIPQQYGGFKQLDPKVVFLGTGSMMPSKYRNVSSIYVEMTESFSLLLDCGEGSYYQLFNHFGEEHIDEAVLKIKAVFITHIHSDHNLGILDLIAQRNKLLRKKFYKMYKSESQYEELLKDWKLFLIIPYNVLPWFNSYVSNVQNLLQGCDILFVQTILNQSLELSNATVSKDDRVLKINPTQTRMKDESQESDPERCDQENTELQAYFSPIMKSLYNKYSPSQPQVLARFSHLLDETGLDQFTPVHVQHCPQSFAIVIKHRSGVKISYSGDCRPSEQFAKAAYKSTLLIHEATFGDDLHEDAKQKMHSTVGEAIDLALLSESWKLALTHFSQRYISAKQIVDPSLYKLNEKKRQYALNHSIVCFDHLRMKMSQLPVLVYQSRKICEIFPSDSLE